MPNRKLNKKLKRLSFDALRRLRKNVCKKFKDEYTEKEIRDDLKTCSKLGDKDY